MIIAVAVLLLAVTVFAAGGYLLWQRQLEARLIRSRAAGIDAVAAERYAEGLHAIGRYLQRHPSDSEALVHYAAARLRVEEPDGSHIRQTTRALRRALDLRPDNLPAQHLLLQTYLGAGFDTEALDTADAILATHPADAVALRGEANALLNLGRVDEALDAAQLCNDAHPQDLPGQILTLQIFFQQNVPAEQIVARAAALREAHGDDPRFLLLQSIAHSFAEQFDEARRYASEAAVRPLPTSEVLEPLVRQLDDLELFEESFAVLSQAADQQNALEPRRQFIARLWENGQAEQVAQRLDSLGHDSGDTELLAFRAMAQAELGHRQKAEADIAALLRRRADPQALAWASVLPVVALELDPPAREVIRVVLPALSKIPRNAWLLDRLGQAYAELGEQDLAAQQWIEAAHASRSWATPLDRLARLLLERGRAAEAEEAAQAAARRTSEDPEVLATLVKARMALLSGAQPSAVKELIRQAKHVQQLRPNEPRSLEALVRLLLREGRRGEAIEVMQRVQSGDPPPVPAFLDLAELSREQGLGLEKLLLDACEQAHGLTPELALAKARRLAAQGQIDEGRRLLESALVPADADWQLARARYFDQIDDPGARQAWIDLGQAFPDELDVQWAALHAVAVEDDRPFQGQTIDRLKALLGEQAMSWRLARARWLLSGPASEKDSAEAAMLLGQISRQAPHLLAPRLLLAECLQRLGDTEGAIEQLTLAAEAQPTPPEAQLQLARILEERGEFERADRYLSAMLSSELASQAQRQEAVRLLAQRGRPVDALRLLEQAQARTGRAAPADLTLASLYREQGQSVKAEAIYRQLLRQSAPEAAVVKDATDFFVGQGKWDQAEQAIARLEDATAPPGIKELVRGEYLFRRANTADAETQFRAATTAAPRNSAVWMRLVAHHLISGHGEKAVQVAEAALEQVQESHGLRLIQENRALVTEVAADPLARPLLLALLRPEHETGELDALRLIADVRRKGQGAAELAKRLTPIAEARPASLSLQLVLIKVCEEAGDAQRGVAAAVKAADAFPAAEEPARLAAEGLAGLGRWSEAIRAAQQWRQRSPASAYRADLVIAAANLAQGRFRQALGQVEPHLASGAEPEGIAEATLIAARAHLELQQPDRAKDLLVPLLRQSPRARMAWARLIGRQLAASDAAGHLQLLEQLTPVAAFQERVVLAEAWESLEGRFSGEFAGELGRALNSAQRLAQAAVATPCDLLSLAMLLERSGRLAEAEANYRRVLALQPLPVAQNNLAMLLLRREGNLSEALTLARAAADSGHPLSDQFLDTLAQVQAARNEHRLAAQSMTRAIQISPQEPAWQVRLAALLLKDGQVDQARTVLDQVERIAPAPSLSEEDQHRLAQLRAMLAAEPEARPAGGT